MHSEQLRTRYGRFWYAIEEGYPANFETLEEVWEFSRRCNVLAPGMLQDPETGRIISKPSPVTEDNLCNIHFRDPIARVGEAGE